MQFSFWMNIHFIEIWLSNYYPILEDIPNKASHPWVSLEAGYRQSSKEGKEFLGRSSKVNADFQALSLYYLSRFS